MLDMKVLLHLQDSRSSFCQNPVLSLVHLKLCSKLDNAKVDFISGAKLLQAEECMLKLKTLVNSLLLVDKEVRYGMNLC